MFLSIDNRQPPRFSGTPAAGESRVRRVNGHDYFWNGSSWVVIPPDPYFSSVKGLWHFDSSDTNGTQIKFADSSGNNNYLSMLTGSGAEVPTGISQTQSKFNNASFQLVTGWNPHNTGLSSSVNIGTGDFTLEGFFYRNSNVGQSILMNFANNNNAQTVPFIKIGSTGTALFGYAQSPTIEAVIFATTAITLNTWHYWAISRNSGTSWLYFDGAAEGGSFADSANFASMQQVHFGSVVGATTNSFLGFVDETRLTVGIGRYPGGTRIPIPTMPFANY